MRYAEWVEDVPRRSARRTIALMTSEGETQIKVLFVINTRTRTMTTITSNYTEAPNEPWGVLLKGDTL